MIKHEHSRRLDRTKNRSGSRVYPETRTLGDKMDTGKTYYDSEGNECSIWQLVRREPEWAANRIQAGEKAIERVKLLEEALHRYIRAGCGDGTHFVNQKYALDNAKELLDI